MSDLKILLYIKYAALILSYMYDYTQYIERCVRLTALPRDAANVYGGATSAIYAVTAICKKNMCTYMHIVNPRLQLHGTRLFVGKRYFI